MLKFKLEEKEKIHSHIFSKMPLIDIMNDDRPFTITVDEQVFFDDIYFPIREFVKYSLTWLKKSKKDFIYNTIDNEENPLLAFHKQKDGWKIYSVWQKYECDKVFSDSEMKNFISEIISQVIL